MFENLTQEQRVMLAAGPGNINSAQSSAAMNALMAALAPPPRPTPNLTRDMVISQRTPQTVKFQG